MSEYPVIKLISNYLRIWTSPPGNNANCQTCPELDAARFAKDIKDFESGTITNLPIQTGIQFNKFLQAHSKQRMVVMNNGFSVFLNSHKNLKATASGLYLSHNFGTSDLHLMVIGLLTREIHGLESYNDIPRYVPEIAKSLQDVIVKIKVAGWENRQYTVTGVCHDNAHNLYCQLPKGELISIFSFLRDHKGVTIQYPEIPCLELEDISSNFTTGMPFEVCHIISPQHYNPSNEVVKESKVTRLSNPADRLRKICLMASDEFPVGDCLHNFNLRVDPVVTPVDGKVITPPNLVLGTSKQGLKSISINNLTDNKWDYAPLLGSSGYTVCLSNKLKKWVLIQLVERVDRTFEYVSFAESFERHCKQIGINLLRCAQAVQRVISSFDDPTKLKEVLDMVVAKNGVPELILFIMPKKNAGYKFLKYYTEVEFGIRSQFLMEDRARRAGDNIFTSLGLKINAKFGGSNIQLDEQTPLFDSNEIMIVGADVNHPVNRPPQRNVNHQPQNNTDPPKSIAAVVGSVDGKCVSRYIARFSQIDGGSEKITQFGKLVMDIVMNFEKMQEVKPNKIIIFRDGVGFDKFEMVIKEELESLKKLFTDEYRPHVTLVLVVKRHSTRIFRDEPMGVNAGPDQVSRNVPAGTVVDSKIVHPNHPNFYMCTHDANRGTSKPKHFYVLYDENDMEIEEIEKICYHMCFVSAHHTSPIPLVPPVHYADLAAYRSRMHYDISRLLNSRKDQPSENSSFHNTMFFL